MQFLKQSTAITLRYGPFLDDTDGKTAETGLTISQADVRLSKAGGAFAQKNDATSATHDENGWYSIPLDATDTGTLGTLIVAIAESGALPVWREFSVVPSNVWDSMFSTDKLQVDAVEISSDSTAADNLEAILDGTGAVATLSQLRIDSSAAGGAIDIDNDAGPCIDIDALSTITAVDITGGGASLKLGASSGEAVLAAAESGANASGIKSTGDDYGAGFHAIGGTNGEGILGYGGATSGHGIRGFANGGNSTGINGHGNGTGAGIRGDGGGSGGPGVLCEGGGNGGTGLYIHGNSSDATGLHILTVGAGKAVHIDGSTTGDTIVIEGGDTSGDAIDISTTDGIGIDVTAAGDKAASLVASTGNNDGLYVSSSGSGDGISTVGGATGNGLKIAGGGSSGPGITVATTNGVGVVIGASGDNQAVDINGSGTGAGVTVDAGATGTAIDISAALGTCIDIDSPITITAIDIAGGGASLKLGASGGEAVLAAAEGSSNASAIKATGDGSGDAINLDGGATGSGAKITGAPAISITGDDHASAPYAGIVITGGSASGTGAGANAVTITGGDGSTTGDGGHGIQSTGGSEAGGQDDGSALKLVGVGGGRGLHAVGGGASGGHAAFFEGGANGSALVCDGSANANGNGIGCTGGSSGYGISGTAGLAGILGLATFGSSGVGIDAVGSDTAGMRITGGGQGTNNGPGLVVRGGTSSGNAVELTARGGNSDSVELTATGSGSCLDMNASAGIAIDIDTNSITTAVSITGGGATVELGSSTGKAIVATAETSSGMAAVDLTGDGAGKDLDAKEIGTPVTLGDGASISDMLTAIAGKTANAGSYDRTTDSNEAIRDKLADVETDTQDLQTQVGTAGAGLTDLGGMSTGMKAEVNAEVDTALSDIGLDHLLSAAVIGTDVTDNSVVAKLASKSATADWDSYDNTTDSLEAISVDAVTITELRDELHNAMYVQDVLTRHANDKPKTFNANTGAARILVTTTQDGAGNTDTQTYAADPA